MVAVTSVVTTPEEFFERTGLHSKELYQDVIEHAYTDSFCIHFEVWSKEGTYSEKIDFSIPMGSKIDDEKSANICKEAFDLVESSLTNRETPATENDVNVAVLYGIILLFLSAEELSDKFAIAHVLKSAGGENNFISAKVTLSEERAFELASRMAYVKLVDPLKPAG